MNKIMTINAVINFAEVERMLKYMEQHSYADTYKRIKKSYTKIIVWTLVILAIFMLILIIGLFTQGSYPLISEHGIAYETTRGGHIGYDNIWYTSDSKKYIITPSDYDYDINDYVFNDLVTIYYDAASNIVDIVAKSEGLLSQSDIHVLIFTGLDMGCVVLLIFYTVWIRYSKSKLNPGSEYFAAMRWYYSQDKGDGWYYGY